MIYLHLNAFHIVDSLDYATRGKQKILLKRLILLSIVMYTFYSIVYNHAFFVELMRSTTLIHNLLLAFCIVLFYLFFRSVSFFFY